MSATTQLAIDGIVPSDIRQAATANLANRRVVGIAASGHLGSGKDTIIPAVLSRLALTSPIDHQFFSQPMKAEFADVLRLIRWSDTDSDAAVLISHEMGICDRQAQHLVGLVADLVRRDPHIDGYSRTPEVRAGLQYLGTDIRRAADENYWARLTFRGVLEGLAAGHSVYLTDCRFVNEAVGAQAIGLFLVRLDVTDATQADRIWARDRTSVDPAAIRHPSETSLDTYQHFDLRVSNDGPPEVAITAILEALAQR